MNDQCVVIVGAPLERQTVYGPFPSFGAAASWANEATSNEYTWIATLHAPTEDHE